MVKRYTLSLLLFTLIFNNSFAQTTADYAIQLTATTQVSPTKITLNWPLVSGATAYFIYKKSKTATGWGSVVASLSATDTMYTDNAVIVDSAYEYKVSTTGATGAAGYIYAGVKCPAIHNRGILILIVDSLFADSCKTDVDTLTRDIIGDGWQLIRHDVGRNMRDTAVKRLIINDYNGNSNVQSVFLLGHVAVPYSGLINPDGHPDHLGAWPSDAYYADVNGIWTDVSVVDTASGILAANKNAPGDGKWDQSDIPSAVELQIGRVDFYNMPAFGKTEVQLMRSYLQRDHLYKMDLLNVNHRALVDDNFGPFSGEAFAANAWRNFSTLVGKNNVKSLDFVTTLKDSSYQWAYGCGGGYFQGAGGIGSTSDFAANNVNAIFTSLFGSYFGDWNVQNNFLRAPLCSNIPALTCFWAGRPNWFLHHMALGEPIGYGTKLTMNNSIYNNPGYGQNGVHIALMGDPTLRTDYIAPAKNVLSTATSKGATITWMPSSDPSVIGYYVYRADTSFGPFKKTSPLISGSGPYSFDDTIGKSGTKYYMVRPVKLQQTPSGYYYNLGIGEETTSLNNVVYANVKKSQQHKFDLTLFPNPTNNNLNLAINSNSNFTANIYIIDGGGRRVYSNTQPISMGDNAMSINVASFAPGTYSLIVQSGKEMQTRKWVKTN